MRGVTLVENSLSNQRVIFTHPSAGGVGAGVIVLIIVAVVVVLSGMG